MRPLRTAGIVSGLAASLFLTQLPRAEIGVGGPVDKVETPIVFRQYPHIEYPKVLYFDGSLSLDGFTGRKWCRSYEITVPATPRGYSLSKITGELRNLGEKEATWQVLQNQNNVKNSDLIYPGMKLIYVMPVGNIPYWDD